MNYEKIYHDLCKDRKVRGLTKEVGYEFHHIVPRSLGGKDCKDNLVKFSCREHYVAHKLLSKIYKHRDKTSYSKMVNALWWMSHNTKVRNVLCKDSKEYERNRTLYHEIGVQELRRANGHKEDILRTDLVIHGIELISNFKELYPESKTRRSISEYLRFSNNTLSRSHDRVFCTAVFKFCVIVCKLGYRGLSGHARKGAIMESLGLVNITYEGQFREFVFTEQFIQYCKNIKGKNLFPINYFFRSLLHNNSSIKGLVKFLESWNSLNKDKLLYSKEIDDAVYLFPVNNWDTTELVEDFTRKPIKAMGFSNINTNFK
jgi:hypothetical protein